MKLIFLGRFTLDVFSIGRRKTNTKVLTVANHNTVNQSGLKANTWENEQERVMIGFGIISDWTTK